MPLFYQKQINQYTKLAIWKIEETEDFFLQTVQLQQFITHPHKRLQHLAGRYLLKYLYSDFPNELILIASTKKPYLQNEAYHFSISHCGDYAAAIVSKKEKVGIDIEICTEKILKIANKFTSKDEIKNIKYILQSTNDDVQDYLINDNYQIQVNEKQETRNKKQETVLTLIWSAKESMFKWYGLGNVDFKKMLEIKAAIVKAEEQDFLKAIIYLPAQKIDLNINYKIFKSMILTYVSTL